MVTPARAPFTTLQGPSCQGNWRFHRFTSFLQPESISAKLPPLTIPYRHLRKTPMTTFRQIRPETAGSHGVDYTPTPGTTEYTDIRREQPCA